MSERMLYLRLGSDAEVGTHVEDNGRRFLIKGPEGEPNYLVASDDDVVEAIKVRWCDTHDCQHMFKDACSRRMAAFARRDDGAVNIGEQMDGPKECTEGWRWIMEDEV